MDIEAQFMKDGEPDSEWFFVVPTYLHPDIRHGLEAILESTYVDKVEITYNVSLSNVISTVFRRRVETVSETPPRRHR